MLSSPINKQDDTIRTDAIVHYETTYLALNGPILELEGYASIKDLLSFAEDRIRKTLLLVPEVDITAFRKKHAYEEEYEELTDQDIIGMHTTEVSIDNCSFGEVYNHEESAFVDKESLGGFKLELNLAEMNDGKPLPQGAYKVYLNLEQLSNDNDDIKFQKTIPISDVKKFLTNGMLTTKLQYFSPSKHMKYNLIASFGTKDKTLVFENTLLQSFNPKEFYEEEANENRYVQAFKRRAFKLAYILFSLLPVNKKKLSIASDSRTNLSGNLYFIYEEIYQRDLNLKIKLVLNERIDNKKTLFSLISNAYHFATSKIILLDDFYPMIYPLNIRKKSDLIQVWHAAGAFKTFGFSRTGRPGGPSPRSRNHRNYTKTTVSSEGVREHYAEGFGISVDRVYPTGVPRADIFFDEEYKKYVRETLYERYPYLKDKKVILFAPTFRGNGQGSAYFPFNMIDFKELYENLSDEYVFLFKIHPFVNNELSIPYEYRDFFYDFSSFREINDLLLITDLLITDYSSVCFEFALLNKPMLFFAFDVEEYIRTRDFYYDYFDFIPGPLVRSTKEIVNVINEEQFAMEKIEPFVDYFFNGTLGHASRNVVDQVIIPSLEDDGTEETIDKEILPPPASRIDLFERSLEEEDDNT